MSFKNRKATYNFEIIEKYSAGLVLFGSEVKSLRQGYCSISESFCFIDKNNEIFIKNSSITPIDRNYSHEATRDRKLLLNKREIIKLKKAVSEKGLSIVPLDLCLNEGGIYKLTIALARGKKNYDKRASLKEQDIKKSLSRL